MKTTNIIEMSLKEFADLLNKNIVNLNPGDLFIDFEANLQKYVVYRVLFGNGIGDGQLEKYEILISN